MPGGGEVKFLMGWDGANGTIMYIKKKKEKTERRNEKKKEMNV